MNSMKLIKLFFYTVAAVLVFSCSTEDELIEDWIATTSDGDTTDVVVETYDVGSMDASKYVALGNSLTAGYTDGALSPKGQANSFAALLGAQLEAAGGGAFVSPNIVSGNGNSNGTDSGTGTISIDLAAALAFLQTGQGSIADALVVSDGSPLTTNTEASINNYGVPGARTIDVVTAGYGTFNGFFGAFQTSAATSVVADIAVAGGSFFSVWLGSNDVLGYTLDGGENDTYNPFDPSTITSTADFSAALSATLDALSATGAEGVILNIPPLTTIPYMQVVTELGGGVDLVPLTDQATVDQLEAAFNVPFPSPVDGVDPGYNSLLDLAVTMGELSESEAESRKISWILGANPPLMTDESLTPLSLDVSAFVGLPDGSFFVEVPQLRQATSTDLFPLDALFVLGVEVSEGVIAGVTTPLADSLTLTLSEQATVITAYATFNAIIEGEVAARSNLELIDVHPLFADINGLSATEAALLGMTEAGIAAADGVFGLVEDGVTLVPLSLDEVQLYNSIFSTDFVHPNPRGAGLITNEVIDHLNERYGANIPSVDIIDLTGINAPL